MNSEEVITHLKKTKPGNWGDLDDQPHYIPFACPVCGRKGDVCELLVRDGDTIMRCPGCGSAGWEYE